MQRRYIRIFLIILAFCQLGAKGMGAMAAPSKSERAIWSIIVIVDGDARGAFLDEVTKFADKEAFAIRTSQPRQDGTHFLVQMWREDVNILILNPFDDPTEFHCAFYQTGSEPVPDAVAHAAMSEDRPIPARQWIAIAAPSFSFTAMFRASAEVGS